VVRRGTLNTGNWELATGDWQLTTEVQRLVIRAPNPLGDAIMALPAMAAVRGAMSGRHLVVAAPPSVAPLFEEVTAVAPDQVVVVEKAREAAQLRELRADAVLLFTNSFRTAWVSRQAAVPRRLGYRAHARSLLLTRAVAKPQQRVHQAEYYLHLVRSLGLTADEQPRLAPDMAGVQPTIRITAATRARAETFLADHGVDTSKPVVGLAPGAAYGHAKRWPPDRVAQLVTRLDAAGVRCVLVGAAGDRDAGREIESTLPAGISVVNVIGRTDLRLLAGLLASCHAFVANDSGAMHLAAATGVPVTAIFGPTDERVTAPLGHHDVILQQVFCRPCMLRDCPIDHRCMRRISVDRVYQSVTGRLAARGAVEPRA
jgi:heptosyltransferase II